MMMSISSRPSEVPQPDFKDPDAQELPKTPIQNHTMMSSTSSTSEVPQLDYEDSDAPDYEDPGGPDDGDPGGPDDGDPGGPDNGDPGAPELPNPPSTNHRVVSNSNSSSEVPQPDCGDPDAKELSNPSKPNHTMASTEAPHPDYKDTEASVPAVTESGSQSQHEVKPVPRPRSKIKKKAEGSSSSDSTDKTNSPATEEIHQNNECPQDNKRPHPVPPPPRPPMNKLNTSGKPTADSDGGNQNTGSNTKAAVKPPAVGNERTQSAPSRPERPPPPSFYYGKAPATQSKSCSEESQQTTCSSSSAVQTAFPDKVLSLDESYGEMAKDGKNKPAVPPRPKQSRLPCYASLCESSSPPQIRPPAPLPPTETPSEPLYSVIDADMDERPYLEILPNKEDKMIKPLTPTTEKRSASVNSEKNLRPLFAEYQDTMKQRGSWPRSGSPSWSGRSSPRAQSIEDTEDISGMLRWLKKVSKPDYMTPSVYGLSIEEEVRSCNHRAVNVSKGLRLYNLLMMKRNEGLRNIITEFCTISESLDKMQQKKKTMDIAGGTTGAVGGVAAVVGIALAPVTLGASLIATAVGAGMVVSAGGMSARTSKASKKIVNRTSVEQLVDEYMTNVVDLEHCLDFILSGMNELRRHDIGRLNRAGTQSEAVKMAQLSQSVFRVTTTNNNTGTSVAHASGMSSEKLLQAFSKEMDQYFTEDGLKLKKMNKSKFSGRLHLLAENLHDELEHLNHMWRVFT
ncbi:hypothetical protein Q5P01_017622 [Channa striata]|uniref:Uncharacterized protein n=1 Tax=Channa striata TaxID=64152 RepID=A0AA88MAK3_CHASR|nr:hypothetical protein Q5P01_017622 [Channa striata]